MKGAIQAHNPGNWKMRGKKCIDLSCGCCVIQNLKDKVLEQASLKEIERYKSGAEQYAACVETFIEI